MLIKDPDKRLKLKEVLQHPWILSESKDIGEIRSKSVSCKDFMAFTLTTNDIS